MSVAMMVSNKPVFPTFQVTVAGTPKQLPTYTLPDGMGGFTLTNRRSNSGNFYIADSSANALLTASRKELVPGQSLDVPIDDPSRLWADADNATDYLELGVFTVAKS